MIEVVGAFFMMVVILVFITGIFVENGRQRQAATELMRERLSATASLDMIVSDLEGAVYVAPADGQNADDHPWRVLAEGSGELGATAIRFVTQNAAPTRSNEHGSNWVEVAYFLEENRDGDLTLWRWRSLRPPHEVPRGFPDSDDPDSARIAVEVSDFGIRLLDVEGNWLDEWDSSYQPPDQSLPEAAEVSIALFRAPRRGEAVDSDDDRVPGLLHTRRVSIVMRPIDVDAILALAAGEAGEADCFTIQQCLETGNRDWYQVEISTDCGGDDELCRMLENPNAHCWSQIEISYPEVASDAPEACAS